MDIDYLNLKEVGGETVETTEKCYCLEMFRKTDPNVQGECLKMKCGRYKLEEKRKVEWKTQYIKGNIEKRRKLMNQENMQLTIMIAINNP